MKLGIKDKFIHQRKIWKDSTKNLNVDRSNILAFPLNRIDLIFWQNISDLGNKVSDMKNSVTIERFNFNYNGLSLFHHFSSNTDVIEMIHNSFINLKNDG